MKLFCFIPTQSDMAVEYSLLMQKTKDGSTVKSSLSDFGFAVCDIPWPPDKTQEVAKREWPGEHGEDAYVPPGGLKLQAYDLEVEFCYKGAVNTAYAQYKAMRNYLIGASGDGAELKIYDPYWKRGRTNVRLLEIDDLKPNRDNVGEVLSAKIKFRIADPMTEIGAGTNASGETISLGAV